MPNLPKTGKKIISANARRQARHAAKMRAKGLKKLTLWVTPEEEQIVRNVLLEFRQGQKEKETR